MQFAFQRIAIVNRGEPAMRLIHAVQDINLEHGCNLRTIALYTHPDQHSLFVREADESYCLGPALFTDPQDGSAKSRYLDLDGIAQALLETRAEAVWVGWGFLSERPEFAELVRELGMRFVGPPAEVMRRLGDKIASKQLAEGVGVPVADWSRGPVETLEDAQRHADRLGFPLLIKATAGGGGRGIRRVRAPEELPALLASARAEALKAFGDGTVFLEALVNRARHVEVQILADQQGAVWAVGVRDCTLQRRNQKVLEEAPCPLLSPETEKALREASIRLARAAGYQNAGTVEFLLEPGSSRFYFMEMNTRLQVEHPVTEVTTGLDLVRCQLQIADGQPLVGEPPPTQGHAIEVRLNAEDPDQGFAPAPGRLVMRRLPTGANVRVDTGVAMGDTIPADFDSMIAKLIVWGKTRQEALGRMRRALSELVTVIDGGRTNKAFLLELLGLEAVWQNQIDIQWLDRTWDQQERKRRPYGELALAEAAIRVYERTLEQRRQAFQSSAVRGRIELSRDLEGRVELRHLGRSYTVWVSQVGPSRYRLRLEGRSLDVALETLSQYERQVRCQGQVYRAVTSLQGTTFLVEVNGILHKISNDQGGTVTASAPGVILAVHVKAGDMVQTGQSLLVMEAMKVETSVVASFSGTVRAVIVNPGQYVPAGGTLLVLEPAAEAGASGADPGAGGALCFPVEEEAATLEELGRRTLLELRHFALGYEVRPDTLRPLLQRWSDPRDANRDEPRLRGVRVSPWHALMGTAFLRASRRLEALEDPAEGRSEAGEARAEMPVTARLPSEARGAEEGLAGQPVEESRPAEGGAQAVKGGGTRGTPSRLRLSVHKVESLLALEDEILAIAADTLDLFERRPHGSREQGLSRGECLLSLVHGLDPEDERLPVAFVAKLRRVAAWHGLETLRAGDPGLLEVLLRAHQGYRNLCAHPDLLAVLLQNRLESLDTLSPFVGESQRQILLQLIDATHDHLGQLSELVRLLLYRQFEAASLERAQRLERTQLATALAALQGEEEPTQRELRMRTLLSLPQPLEPLVWEWLEGDPDVTTQCLSYELLVRRLYGQDPGGIMVSQVRPGLFQVGITASTGRQVVLGSVTGPGELVGVLKSLASHLVGLARDPDWQEASLLADLLTVRWEEAPDDDAAAATLQACLAQVSFPVRPARLGFRVLCNAGEYPERYFTFVPDSDNSFVELVRFRNILPARIDRLELHRLEHFHLERLPSEDGIYLFRGVARENAQDTRIFCCLEVENLESELGAQGRVVRLPALERRLLPALDGMRDHLYSHPQQHLEWNQISIIGQAPPGLRKDALDHLLAGSAFRLANLIPDLGVERVTVHAFSLQPEGSRLERVLELRLNRGSIQQLLVRAPQREAVPPLTAYARTVARMRRRGIAYPYEIVRLMTPPAESSMALIPRGTFQELDLDPSGGLGPVTRPYGRNVANVVVGIIQNFTPRHPEGMTRILILGDASRDMGALAEPECARILAAIDLAEARGIPVEWFPVSSGARIAMDSGTENLDWTAAVLRRLITFTQAGGEVNIVVDGVSVGAQSYWNAEATMMMHARGILIMTPTGSMVLTGKRALEYSGSVSAETHEGIGGVEQIMGPNGEAQYMARDIPHACQILLQYYGLTYKTGLERFPRWMPSVDPRTRDVASHPVEGRAGDSGGFKTVGEIFSRLTNPGRKRPFPIRPVMRAVMDTDCEPLERWALWRDAETAVVWDARLGGYPISLLGIESRNVPRAGFVPADGPESWSGGTLYPNASRKMARAINAASGSRPVVVLANLSGFDGSPESMRRLQLEFGAELGRAVVNFKGPILFCVISRFHGGAYVVFSRTLNPHLTVVALEGSYASVIGGAPAAAVVFPGEVKARTQADPRLVELREKLSVAGVEERARLSVAFERLYAEVHAEKLGKLADEFDAIHSVERARQVGSLHDIIPSSQLRPFLIEALERGMARILEEGRSGAGPDL